MSGNQNVIHLYPSNWLYNAGVVGFLNSVEDIEQIGISSFVYIDSNIRLDTSIFGRLDLNRRYFGKEKIAYIVGQVQRPSIEKILRIYNNYLQPAWKNKGIFNLFVSDLQRVQPRSGNQPYCFLCGNGFYIDSPKAEYQNFLKANSIFSFNLHSHLLPAKTKFPNSFWNMTFSARVCHLCIFLIIHYHLAFTEIGKYKLGKKGGNIIRYIFINAPSFKAMWELNKISQKFSDIGIKEILGYSLIEWSEKMMTNIGVWTQRELEAVQIIVIKEGNKNPEVKIDFFSLPYEIVKLLINRNIASLLKRLDEPKIFSLFLNGNFGQIMKLGEILMRIGLKDGLSDGDMNFLQDELPKNFGRDLDEAKAKRKVREISYKIFELLSTVKEVGIWG